VAAVTSSSPATIATLGASQRAARRAILLAQAVASLGLAAGGAAGGLLAVAVTGNEAMAAAPLGALVLGAGCSAPVAAAAMARRGRRAGLLHTYLLGVLGAAVVLIGAGLASVPWLLLGNLLLGSGNTAVMLSRYVVADLSGPEHRGRAISTSLFTITLGAVIGPNLLGPTSPVATAAGLPGPAGMYVVALLMFALAPLLLALTGTGQGTEVAGDTPADPVAAPAPSTLVTAHATARRSALVVMTTANVAMVGIMAVAPVHLEGHGHGLGIVGLLISLHVGAMYVGSPLIGRLVDGHGSRPVAASGAVLFIIVGIVPTMTGDAGLDVTAALLLGLGVAWNVQIIAGSALLHQATPPSIRPSAEARGELAMSLGAAAASLLVAGPLLAAGGLALLAAATVPMHLLVLVLISKQGVTPP
jgi:MFS family permease